MEQSSDGVRQIDPEAEKWLGQVHAAALTLRAELAGSAGIRVEEKSVSVAVHWRQAPDHATAADEVRRVTARIADELGLRLEPGKLVEELRPPIDVDKGSAISALLAAHPDLSAFAYAGDDLGDIPALRAARDAGGYALVIDHGQETDPRLLELADETFPGTDAFADWLADTGGPGRRLPGGALVRVVRRFRALFPGGGDNESARLEAAFPGRRGQFVAQRLAAREHWHFGRRPVRAEAMAAITLAAMANAKAAPRPLWNGAVIRCGKKSRPTT